MSTEEIDKIEKEVNKLKFKATMKASDLHDLIEDRLLSDFEDIPSFAEATYAACKAWKEASLKLKEAKGV